MRSAGLSHLVEVAAVMACGLAAAASLWAVAPFVSLFSLVAVSAATSLAILVATRGRTRVAALLLLPMVAATIAPQDLQEYAGQDGILHFLLFFSFLACEAVDLAYKLVAGLRPVFAALALVRFWRVFVIPREKLVIYAGYGMLTTVLASPVAVRKWFNPPSLRSLPRWMQQHQNYNLF